MIFCLMTGTMVKAQDTVQLNLKEALKLGLQNSRELKINHAKIDQAIARFQQAKDAKLPDVKIAGAFLQLNHPNVDMKTGASGGGQSEMVKPSTAMYGMATASIPVYSGSKIKNGIEAARYLQEAAKFDAENDKEKIILNITPKNVENY